MSKFCVRFKRFSLLQLHYEGGLLSLLFETDIKQKISLPSEGLSFVSFYDNLMIKMCLMFVHYHFIYFLREGEGVTVPKKEQ